MRPRWSAITGVSGGSKPCSTYISRMRCLAGGFRLSVPSRCSIVLVSTPCGPSTRAPSAKTIAVPSTLNVYAGPASENRSIGGRPASSWIRRTVSAFPCRTARPTADFRSVAPSPCRKRMMRSRPRLAAYVSGGPQLLSVRISTSS